MATYPTHADTPELQAHYDTMSPNARAFVDRWIAWTETLDDQSRQLADFGLDVLLTATKRKHELAAEIAEHVVHDVQETDILIGTIDGCEVIGSYTESGKLFSTKMTWNGLTFHTDGADYINFTLGEAGDGYDELGCAGDMHLWEWSKIKELASTDVMEQLITLARKKAQRA